jgi:D-alanyl-D-alanine-carboxypeptidase/D-alanyl-D-alanine-endopeptidase
VIGAVRNGERAIAGFGTTSTGSSAVPDGKTIFRIGSVTKAFTGAVLASTAVEGTIALTDRLEQHLGWDVKVPTRDGKAVRLIDLATHSGGFPREVPHEPGPTNDPFSTITKSAFVALLCSRTNASPFWIMLLLVSGRTDHAMILGPQADFLSGWRFVRSAEI